MDSAHVENDLVNVLFTEAQIQQRLQEMAEEIERDYEGEELLIVGILRGAVTVLCPVYPLAPPPHRAVSDSPLLRSGRRRCRVCGWRKRGRA